MDESDYSEVPPPDAATVAKRAIVLATVTCRAFVDKDKKDSAGAGQLAKQSCDWLRSLGLDGQLTDWEQKLLSTKFGHLENRDQLDASWLAEGLVVLAWALKCTDLPPFDLQCDPAETANSLGFLQPQLETVLANPSLRSAAELAEYNEFIYNVHWRIRDFSSNRSFYDFESLAEKAWGKPILRFGLKLREKDIEFRGAPLFKSTGDAWRDLSSITQERHRAANWLIGYASTNYYEVTTDT